MLVDGHPDVTPDTGAKRGPLEINTWREGKNGRLIVSYAPYLCLAADPKVAPESLVALYGFVEVSWQQVFVDRLAIAGLGVENELTVQVVG